jgi:hypothetical protein
VSLFENEEREDEGDQLQQADGKIRKEVRVIGPEAVSRKYRWVRVRRIREEPSQDWPSEASVNYGTS